MFRSNARQKDEEAVLLIRRVNFNLHRHLRLTRKAAMHIPIGKELVIMIFRNDSVMNAD